jgi:hypothetical protein
MRRPVRGDDWWEAISSAGRDRPKNDHREAAVGNFLLTALGLGARGRWSERKYLLFERLIQYGVECLVIDDAHDLSMPHLIFLKELTDQLQLSFSQTLGSSIFVRSFSAITRLLFLPDPSGVAGTRGRRRGPQRKAARQGPGCFAMESAHTSSDASA